MPWQPCPPWLRYSRKLICTPSWLRLSDRAVYYQNVEIELNGNPWYHDIKIFLKDGSYLESANSADRRTLRKISLLLLLEWRNPIYEITWWRPAKMCWCPPCKQNHERNTWRAVWTPHEQIYVSPKNFETWVNWLTMNDFKYVWKCQLDQIYANKINHPPALLHNMASSWPCSIWGHWRDWCDSPKASNRHWYVLVAIGYFSK